ncbi:interferon-induced very large GTPase 1-like [Pleurodeles waltl]
MSKENPLPQGLTPEDHGKKELEMALAEVGLNPGYWLPTLESKLGITNVKALQHAEQNDYKKLEGNVQYDWEKQALQRLIDLPGGLLKRQKWQNEHFALLQQQKNYTKSVLEEIKKKQSDSKVHQDAVVMEKKEELRKAMDIPRDYWVKSGMSLKDIIENLHNTLTIMDGEFEKKDICLSDKEVLRNASGGLALEGVYKTTIPEDALENRERLITIPEEFRLDGPVQSPVLQQKEFSSSSAESMFTRRVEKCGFSLSCSAEAGFWGFQMENSNNYNKSSESETNHKSHSDHSYVCTIKYNYIPLASGYFEMNHLRLSDAALKQLKQTEELLSLTKDGDKKIVDSQFANFFHQFGSHANKGPLHFGGIYWWKASSEGFRAEDLDEVRKMSNEALNIHVGASYGLNVRVAVSEENQTAEACFTGAQKETFQKQIHLSVSKTGGPEEVDSLQTWKIGLVCNNKTWHVIDRGSQFIPVWDIILHNHKTDFKDIHHLSTCLLDSYNRLTNQKAVLSSGERELCALDEAKRFLLNIKSWPVSRAEEKLKKLDDFKQKLNEKVKNYSIWVDICLSNPMLQDILINIVKEHKGSSGKETANIKTLMRCLVEPHISSAENFPGSSIIREWIDEPERQQHRNIHVTGFNQFVEVLQESKNDIMEFINDSKEGSQSRRDDCKLNATQKVRSSLSSLIKALRNTKQVERAFLFQSVVNCIGYCAQSSTFQYPLGKLEIDFMIEEMTAANTKYLALREKNRLQAQAFLLLKALTVTVENKVVSPEQMQDRLVFFKEQMTGSLLNKVVQVLNKHETLGDFNTLQKDLNALISSDNDETQDDLNAEQVIQDMESVCQEGISESGNMSQSNPQNDERITNQRFSDLIKRLNLENYYPRQMKKSDILIICQSYLSESLPPTERELPSYFLQKLMMLDYRARSLVGEGKEGMDSKGSLSGINKTDETHNTIDDFFSFCTNDISDTAPQEKSLVHPMDVQMAIFHCADDFMRQYISTKLAFCQFALPFLVPNPCKSQIEFPLWSLRQVNKKWVSESKNTTDTETNACKEKPITEARLPLVSFMRFGPSHSSKSQILSKLLSKQQHSIFFHRHCKGSSTDCLLMDGVVDIAWYCPSGKDDDIFNDCIAFTNLHGDARGHEKQFEYLNEIAAVNVILLSENDRNEKSISILNKCLKSPTPFICLFADKDNIQLDHSTNKVKIAAKNRNEAAFISELTATIQHLLKNSTKTCSLEECETIAQKHGIVVDESVGECRDGKQRAQKVLSILKEKNMLDMKKTFFPLQGDLWHNWCKNDKGMRRLQSKIEKSLEQQKCDIETAKLAIRKIQRNKAFPLNEFMKNFLCYLHSGSHSKKMYFLQWFSILLDREISPVVESLQQEYHSLWLKKRDSDKPENNQFQGCLDNLTIEIDNSTIGLEHVLREVGQVYEALDAMPVKDEHFYVLPQTAADVMLSGYPIELMDGDAAHVPLKWIDAILDKLIERLGDLKVFVLSILGIQSSGKSTLLNAMFGLQFAVSAGRCTRGAFMQLLKLDDKLRYDLQFDYMLVVDTEGLKGSGKANTHLAMTMSWPPLSLDLET